MLNETNELINNNFFFIKYIIYKLRKLFKRNTSNIFPLDITEAIYMLAKEFPLKENGELNIELARKIWVQWIIKARGFWIVNRIQLDLMIKNKDFLYLMYGQ